jgi:hypothetical protein
MCLGEICSEDCRPIEKHLSDTFSVQNGLKLGNDFSPLIFTFALEYVIRTEVLKFNGAHQIVYAEMIIY